MLAFFVWPGRSEGVARRRAASRVLEMCPECVRAFNEQTTLQCLFAGTLSKPSDGLEPSTPPYHEREEGSLHAGFGGRVRVGVLLWSPVVVTSCVVVRPWCDLARPLPSSCLVGGRWPSGGIERVAAPRRPRNSCPPRKLRAGDVPADEDQVAITAIAVTPPLNRMGLRQVARPVCWSYATNVRAESNPGWTRAATVRVSSRAWCGWSLSQRPAGASVEAQRPRGVRR